MPHPVNGLIAGVDEDQEGGKKMNLGEELEGIQEIVEKDLKTYCFKPPNISWGILFPVVLAQLQPP